MPVATKLHRYLAAVAVAVVALLNPTAAAQYSAPAGNSHPETQLVEGGIEYPFGNINFQAANRPTPQQKSAFAKEVDLAPLRDIAVFHGARVKVLDTLAREFVYGIAGRPDWQDLIPDEELSEELIARGGAVTVDDYMTADIALKKDKRDPLFTLLDLAIDPAYYFDKPFIFVNFLPLREEYLEASFGQNEQLIKRWKGTTRVSPSMVGVHSDAIFNRHMNEQPYREGVTRAGNALAAVEQAGAVFDVVAPESTALPWTNLGSLPANHPARQAAQRLGEAWRSLDATAANAAIAELAAILPTINPETYPGQKRQLELVYHRAKLWDWSYWIYGLSAVLLILAFGTGWTAMRIAGVATLIIAFGIHAVAFTLRCVIAERFAIQNQFESMTGVSLFAALVGLAFMFVRKQPLFGAAAAGTGFITLIAATQQDIIPGQFVEKEAAILNTSVLLKYHVTIVLTSYGLITLGLIASLFLLGAHYGRRFFGAEPVLADGSRLAAAALSAEKARDAAAGDTTAGKEANNAADAPQRKVIMDLDTAQMTVLQLAFWTLGVGILLGAWWADHSWGRWWAFDPKETWALITWIIYLIVIHVRPAMPARKRAVATAWLSIAGFIVMLWTYFGVNLYLPGLHAYA